MKKLCKLVAMLLSCLMAFSFVGCGCSAFTGMGKDDNTTNQGGNGDQGDNGDENEGGGNEGGGNEGGGNEGGGNEGGDNEGGGNEGGGNEGGGNEGGGNEGGGNEGGGNEGGGPDGSGSSYYVWEEWDENAGAYKDTKTLGSDLENWSGTALGVMDGNYESVTYSPDYDEISTASYITYYFDSVNGNDANDGLSADTPKQSVAAANGVISGSNADEAVQVLFKCGSVYNTTLRVANFDAAEETPLIVGTYGKTESAQYATFSGAPYCVEISGSNVRVSGLEVTNPSATRGMYVHTAKAGAMKNVVIRANYIHDVNFQRNGVAGLDPNNLDGSNPNYFAVGAVCHTSRYTNEHSGIYCDADSPTTVGASWFEDMWIENNTITAVARNGIFMTSQWARRPGAEWGNNTYVNDEYRYPDKNFGWYAHKNVYVRENNISFTGGDGIVLIFVNGGYLESNTCYKAQYLGRSGYYNAGIWCHSSKNLVIQFNEASYTLLPNGAGDGQGFDIDIANSNILFRYNYSHDNEGGGILLCNAAGDNPTYGEDGKPIVDEWGLPIVQKRYSPWGDIYIMNNVFSDNGGNVFRIQGALDGLYISNNTVVLNSTSTGIVKSSDYGGTGVRIRNVAFTNNIFYGRSYISSPFDMSYCDSYYFDWNVFHNVGSASNSSNEIWRDPGLGNVWSYAGLQSAKAYAGSAYACSVGLTLDRMAVSDLAGNNVKGKGYIGAVCVQ